MAKTKKSKAVLLSIIAVSLVLSGCATRLGYHWLDWWLQSKLESYVDLNRTQATYTEAALDNFHLWHRQQALPEYSHFLRQIEASLNSQEQITPDLTQKWLSNIVYFWDSSMLQLAAPSAELLRQLSKEQLDDALLAAAEEEQEFMEDIQSRTPQQQLEKRQKQMAKQLKSWIGRLTKEQTELIKHWAQNRKDNLQLAQQANNKWRQTFAEIWQQQLAPTATEDALADLLTRPEKLWSEAYKESIDYNQHLSVELITNLLNSMTEKQRKHLIGQLQSYQKLFNSLSGTSGTA